MGLLSISEMAQILAVSKKEVRKRHKQGLIVGRACNDHREYLYERPACEVRGNTGSVRAYEVQCEA
jgi:hypothetical protein